VRILTLVKQSPLAATGVYGADLMCRQVVEHLAARGHEVTVLTAGGPEGEAGGSPHRRDAGATVRVWSRLVRDRPDPDLPPERWTARDKLEFLRKARHNYAATREALRKLRPEVVYVSDLELLTGSPLRALQEAGTPLVFHAHDLTLRGVVGDARGAGFLANSHSPPARPSTPHRRDAGAPAEGGEAEGAGLVPVSAAGSAGAEEGAAAGGEPVSGRGIPAGRLAGGSDSRGLQRD
jgi:hypothetical protein